jgi:hypothetical protein
MALLMCYLHLAGPFPNNSIITHDNAGWTKFLIGSQVRDIIALGVENVTSGGCIGAV